MGPGPQGAWYPEDGDEPLHGENRFGSVRHAPKARLTRMPIIAGGAPETLERLQRAGQNLDPIVKRWRKPDKVTDGNVESAENLTAGIYAILEDKVRSDPELREAYMKVRRDVERLHDDAMDAISRFKRRKQDSEDERVTKRRAMIVAVRRFYEMAGPLIAELELRSKRSNNQ